MARLNKKIISDIKGFPYVSYESYKALPHCTAVYFITCLDKGVIYIGSTGDLRARFSTYNLKHTLEEYNNLSISWYVCDSEKIMNYEKRFIKFYNPELNKQHTKRILSHTKGISRMKLGTTKDIEKLHELTVGERIVKYRKARRMTQMELAKQAKMSQPFLSDIENGKREGGNNLGLSTAKRIAKVLNVSIDMLAGYNYRANGHDQTSHD